MVSGNVARPFSLPRALLSLHSGALPCLGRGSKPLRVSRLKSCSMPAPGTYVTCAFHTWAATLLETEAPSYF